MLFVETEWDLSSLMGNRGRNCRWSCRKTLPGFDGHGPSMRQRGRMEKWLGPITWVQCVRGEVVFAEKSDSKHLVSNANLALAASVHRALGHNKLSFPGSSNRICLDRLSLRFLKLVETEVCSWKEHRGHQSPWLQQKLATLLCQQPFLHRHSFFLIRYYYTPRIFL